MATVTIIIKDVEDDKIQASINFSPKYDVKEEPTPAQCAAADIMLRLSGKDNDD